MPYPHLPKAAAPAPVVARQSAADSAKLAALLQEQVDADVELDAFDPDDVPAHLVREQAAALEDVDAERQRLSAALSDANSHDEMNALELEIAKLDPVVRHYLAAGDTRVLALSIAGHSPLILSRPSDIAELASLVTYGPDLEQEEGESDEDFARCIGARRLRAIELLTQALTIIVTTKEES